MGRIVWLLILCATASSNAAPWDNIDDHIVGGDDTTVVKFPYQASFRAKGNHVCGCSIINDFWILTAAHCVKHRSITSFRDVTIVVGTKYASYGGRSYAAVSIAAHPLYDSETYQYDVGLVQVKGPIVFLRSVQPIQLVSYGSAPSEGSEVTISGWGVTASEAGLADYPEVLQSAVVYVVDQNACIASYQRQNKTVDISMFCAAAIGKDSCQGDSGGPIVDSNTVQVGVVSWGYGCAQPTYYGVYSNLANTAIRSWIESHANI